MICKGNEIITVSGSNFPVPLRAIRIGNNSIRVISSSANQILIVSPKLNPGLYDLVISLGNFGNALVNTKLDYQFYISSVSPSVGSIRGGTLVTINGQGFKYYFFQKNFQLTKIKKKIYFSKSKLFFKSS